MNPKLLKAGDRVQRLVPARAGRGPKGRGARSAHLQNGVVLVDPPWFVQAAAVQLLVRWEGEAQAVLVPASTLKQVQAQPTDLVKFRGRWRTRLDAARLILRALPASGTTISHENWPSDGTGVRGPGLVFRHGALEIRLYGFPDPLAVEDVTVVPEPEVEDDHSEGGEPVPSNAPAALSEEQQTEETVH